MLGHKFQNKGKSGWTGTSSFVLEVALRHLRPSIIYSVPCDRIVQRAIHLKEYTLKRVVTVNSLLENSKNLTFFSFQENECLTTYCSLFSELILLLKGNGITIKKVQQI